MPTEKQKRIAKEIVNCEILGKEINQTNIVAKAYHYTPKLANKHATDIISSCGVQKAIKDIRADFDSKVSNPLLIREYKQCLKQSDNLAVKLESVKTGFKMKGALSDSVNVDARSVQFNMGADDIARLSECVARMDALADKLALSRVNSTDTKQIDTKQDSTTVYKAVDGGVK